MDRRSTLLAIGGAVPGLMAARVLRAEAAPQTVTTQSYILGTLQYGTVAKKTSIIAIRRSATKAVRDFARGEIVEQDAVASALTSELSPPPPPLTPAQQMTIEEVANAPQPEFDRVYLAKQIAGHRSLLTLQDELIGQTPALNTDTVHTALVAKAFIQNHLFVLQQLISRLG